MICNTTDSSIPWIFPRSSSDIYCYCHLIALLSDIIFAKVKAWWKEDSGGKKKKRKKDFSIVIPIRWLYIYFLFFIQTQLLYFFITFVLPFILLCLHLIKSGQFEQFDSLHIDKAVSLWCFILVFCVISTVVCLLLSSSSSASFIYHCDLSLVFPCFIVDFNVSNV